MVAYGSRVGKARGTTRFFVKILRKKPRGESSVFQVGSLVWPPAPPQLKEKFKGVPPAVELAARVAFFVSQKSL